MAFVLRLHPGLRRMTPPALAWLPQRKRPFWMFWVRKDGTAAIEFAIVGPVLVLMLFGIFTYGSYFVTAHTVQQMANDAARAAIAGLDDDERNQIARQTLSDGISNQRVLRGDIAQVSVVRSASSLRVSVTYDAREDVYWSFASLLPVPSPLISRTATIRLAGY